MLTIAYQTLSNVESIKGSDPEGSVDFFLPSEMLVFYCPNLSEVLLLNACLQFRLGVFLSLVSCLSQGIPKALGRTALQLQATQEEFLLLSSVIFVS